jgi:hypothetical protein
MGPFTFVKRSYKKYSRRGNVNGYVCINFDVEIDGEIIVKKSRILLTYS